MGRDNRQEALAYLLRQAEKQGYVTFDNIMDCADANSLPIKDFDWLTSVITTRGILVYDEVPASGTVSNQDNDDFDDYAQSDYEVVYNRIIELEPSLEDFVTAVRNIVPPQWREFSTLKYQVLEGNQHARERMIGMHLRIALRIALQRAETYDMDIVDAVGDACVGLIMAVDKYNPDTNGPFCSYASMWIFQNISRRQPTRRPLVYYPVQKKEPFFSAYPILKESGYIDEPELLETEDIVQILSDRLSFSKAQTEEILTATTPFDSFEELYSMYSENIDVFEKPGFEALTDVKVPRELITERDLEDQVIAMMLKNQIAEVLETLTDRERTVLDLRYGLTHGRERTLEEIGQMFKVSRERVRQIEAKALRKLRHPSRSKKLRDYIELRQSEGVYED